MFLQQFDDMFGLLQSLEARLTNLHGMSTCFYKLSGMPQPPASGNIRYGGVMFTHGIYLSGDLDL